MFKHALFILLGVCPLYATQVNLPPVIDFGKFPTIEKGYYACYDADVWKLGGYAFNYAPEITPIFAFLKSKYHIDTAIETGTFMGGTTVVLSTLFDQVHTVEVSENHYAIAKELLKSCSNVQCHLGSSQAVFKELLPTLEDKPLFLYLDAHWEHYWPLLDELEEISKTHKDNCILVIDDFKVPGRMDVPYDYHGSNECSYEYIKDKLSKVFTSYSAHFLIPKSTHSRAKLIVIPKQWKNQNMLQKKS